MFRAAAIALTVMSGAAAALDGPELATLTAEEATAFDTLSLPVGPWSPDGAETISAEGALTLRAWRLPQTGRTTLQILAPLREALVGQGYDVLFHCADVACGGFDFRYGLRLLPEPQMHVNLGDFQYLAAQRGEDLAGIVVSLSAAGGHVHIAELTQTEATAGQVLPEPVVTVDAPEASEEPSATPVPKPVAQGGLVEKLRGSGRAVLADLAFATGSSALEDQAFPSLAELALYLNGTPSARVVLVGHSDAEGSLDDNIVLSRRRAQSVVNRLVSAHGVAPGQLRAEGVGYLSPLASNLSEDGRALNRRVEVIKADTE